MSTTPVFDREKAPIYYYGGHGTDICHSKTDLPIVRLVPPNCIYITIAECGYKTFIKGGEEEYFRKKSSKQTLLFPDSKENKAVLARALKRSPSWIHVHMPGTPYVVSNLYPFMYWYDNNEVGVNVSGLLDKSKLEEMGDVGKGITVYPRFIKKETITGEALLNLIGDDKEKKAYASDLMKQIAKPILIQHYHFRRWQANEILRKVAVNISKDEFLNFYLASVHPTKEFVSEVFEKEFPGKTSLFAYEFDRFNDALLNAINSNGYTDEDPRNPLTNTYMMENFPGIHYNVVCREINPRCEVQLQRTLSGVQEQERMGVSTIFFSSVPFEHFFREIKAIAESTEETLNKPYVLRKTLVANLQQLLAYTPEQKQELFDYLKSLSFIQENNANTPNSFVLKYYIKPEEYRYKVLGGTRKQKRKQKQKQKKQKTRSKNNGSY